MNFAQAIDGGVAPAAALKNNPAATAKDITKERLELCRDGGLNTHEIAAGFGCSTATIYQQCSKHRVSMRQQRAGSPEQPPQPVAASDAGSDNYAQEKPNELQSDPFVHEFGAAPVIEPRLIISPKGEVKLLGITELANEKNYVVKFTADFRSCCLQESENGRSFKKGRISCVAVVPAIKAAGIELPAQYDMDPKTQIGRLAGGTQNV